MTVSFTEISYLLASGLFLFGLGGLSSPKTARRGMLLAETGMLLAIIGTLVHREIVTYSWIFAGLALGSVIGAAMAIWIPMTKMPERIALSHSFGGLAVALVGISEYRKHGESLALLVAAAIGAEVLLGAVTFTGSLMAFAKLQGLLPGRPLMFRGQKQLNLSILAALFLLLAFFVATPTAATAFCALGGLGLLFGVLVVLPIGGADMPVVICLLNAYAGLAAAAAGFALSNKILIICGALDGGSGLLLAIVMSKAMNRSFLKILAGGFGAPISAEKGGAGALATVSVITTTVEDVAEVLRAARSLIVIPGYGMAVSQAQHALRDLANALQTQGKSVKYAIHPVAGRMPGHMNVLLAEANIPYDQLFSLEDINHEFPNTDVALVVGANDVVNPAATDKPASPIYGMPVLRADQARTAIVLKRSMSPGFAGVENELFTKPNTLMLLGDAKQTLVTLTASLKN